MDKQIRLKTATLEDFQSLELGDWVEGFGDILSHSNLEFVKKCGAILVQNQEDTTLLDFLQSQTDELVYTGKVVCRQSTSGRGWRLHETSGDDAVKDVRQAIRNYMEENKPTVEKLEAILDGPNVPIQTMPDGSIQTECQLAEEEVDKPTVEELQEILDGSDDPIQTIPDGKGIYFDETKTFEKELEHLINRHSKENASDTPDFILAAYLSDCLRTFNHATVKRSIWYNGK